MRISARIMLTTTAVVAMIGALAMSPVAVAAEKKAMTKVEKGKKAAFNRKKGNCVSCHQIAGGKLAGNIGPPLVAMKARYPKKADLRAHIDDATQFNPNSLMPPFGRHHILSGKDIDLITEFIWTL